MNWVYLHMLQCAVLFISLNAATPMGDFTLYGDVNQDCGGSDIDSHDVTREECAKICSANPDCVGFVYSTNPAASAPCWPKWKLCFSPTGLADTAVYKKNSPAPSLDVDHVSGYETLMKSGHDCYGKDITHHDVTLQECADICETDARCVGFVYSENKVASHLCWPKYELCSNPVPMAHTATFKKSSSTDYSQYGDMNQDCPGFDIDSYDVTRQVCANICTKNSECVGFVYSTNLRASAPCWLKWKLCLNPTHLDATVVYKKNNPSRLLSLCSNSLNLEGIYTGTFIFEKGQQSNTKFITMSSAGDCAGKDIRGSDFSFEECADSCEELSYCVGFVYSTSSVASHPCWLKHALCEKPSPMALTGTFKKLSY